MLGSKVALVAYCVESATGPQTESSTENHGIGIERQRLVEHVAVRCVGQNFSFLSPARSAPNTDHVSFVLVGLQSYVTVFSIDDTRISEDGWIA